MQNGENAQALQKNLDFIRLVSILILCIHFYCACFPAMQQWGLSVQFVNGLLFNLTKGLFFLSGITLPKLSSLFLLAISLFGHQGKKDNKMTIRPILVFLFTGLSLFFLSSFLLDWQIKETVLAGWYMFLTATGYLFLLLGGARLSRLLYLKLGKDIFNIEAETFPQEQRLIENEYSVNLPARYRYKGKFNSSWINVISPTRALLCMGVPGSRWERKREEIRKKFLRDPSRHHPAHCQGVHDVPLRFQISRFNQDRI